jgi:programmed cell death protein 5
MESMDDAELEAIRSKRMAQLQGGGGQGPSKEQQEEMRKQQEDMKNNILVQVLDQPARARLNMIALTKPEKARMVESMLIQMAQRGQVQGKLGEEQLKSLLEQVSEKTQKTTTVKFDRRRAALDSDED